MGRRTASVHCALFVLAVSAVGHGLLAREPDGRGPQIVVRVSVAKEVVHKDDQGRERVELRDAADTGPGDTLVYRITYTNEGREPAHNARIVDPIPAGTRLLPGDWEAPGTKLSASIDGGKSFYPYPIVRKVVAEGGVTTEEEVDPGLYTHLRWTSIDPLPRGEKRTATFKVAVR